MDGVQSGTNIEGIINPAKEAAAELLTSGEEVCKTPIVGGFWVAKEGCDFTGDVIHTFVLEGQNFIIYEPDSFSS